MSTLMNSARAGVRTRVPRFAEAAVERARLTVVPPRGSLGRTQAARTPFAVLVLMMLAAGVVGLLMFNTHMQQASFAATRLQDRVNVLSAEKQALDMELDQLRDPQQLAVAAKGLGMVAPSQPAFIDLATGAVLGNPTPATPDEAVRINSLPTGKPATIRPRRVIVQPTQPASGTGAAAGATTSRTDTPAASTAAARGGDRKRASTNHPDRTADPGATP